MNNKQFIASIKKVSNPRKHTITNSYGVYDGYKYYRKTKPKDSKYIVSESQYFFIIREVNKYLIENLLNQEDIIFPNRMGKLELRKYKPSYKIENNIVKTNLPIDWDKTLSLWSEDVESFNNKTLIRVEEKELFKIYYNKNNANFNNKSFFKFNINRDLKVKLKNKIKEGSIDAFIM